LEAAQHLLLAVVQVLERDALLVFSDELAAQLLQLVCHRPVALFRFGYFNVEVADLFVLAIHNISLLLDLVLKRIFLTSNNLQLYFCFG
jgi:hypothetical protein